MFKRPSPRKRGVDIADVQLGEPKYTERLRIMRKYIQPIHDLKEYLWLLKRHGASDEEVILAKRRNTPGDPLNCIKTYYVERVFKNQPKKLQAVKKFKKVSGSNLSVL